MLDFEPRNNYQVEYTDTFGGEANYCWVCRYEMAMPLTRDDSYKGRKAYDARIKRRAKHLAGLTGIRGTWTEFGDTFEFRPRGMCTVLFVNFQLD